MVNADPPLPALLQPPLVPTVEHTAEIRAGRQIQGRPPVFSTPSRSVLLRDVQRHPSFDGLHTTLSSRPPQFWRVRAARGPIPGAFWALSSKPPDAHGVGSCLSRFPCGNPPLRPAILGGPGCGAVRFQDTVDRLALEASFGPPLGGSCADGTLPASPPCMQQGSRLASVSLVIRL